MGFEALLQLFKGAKEFDPPSGPAPSIQEGAGAAALLYDLITHGPAAVGRKVAGKAESKELNKLLFELKKAAGAAKGVSSAYSAPQAQRKGMPYRRNKKQYYRKPAKKSYKKRAYYKKRAAPKKNQTLNTILYALKHASR